jgi:hypothetical protein
MLGNNKTEEVIEEKKKPDEDWMTKKWRPMMAMMYMSCCLFDFALFPIMFTIVQFWEVQAANDAFRQWVPITLQGGGLFHVAMGAVLGVSAYGRTQEKVAGASNVSTSFSYGGVPTPNLSSSVPSFSGGGFNSQTQSTGFGPQTQSFGSSQSFNTTETTTEFSMSPASVDNSFGNTPTKPIVRRPV